MILDYCGIPQMFPVLYLILYVLSLRRGKWFKSLDIRFFCRSLNLIRKLVLIDYNRTRGYLAPEMLNSKTTNIAQKL